MTKNYGKHHNNLIVRAWLDDPAAGTGPEGGTLMTIAAPDTTASALPTRIETNGSAPGADVYPTGSAGFRYWAAAAALQAASSYWADRVRGLAGATLGWYQTVGPILPVVLDDGLDLNAYYDRQGLKFFHAVVAGRTVYSGESPDIVCHELGHAVLDAIRPELWDAASLEAGAFHESFGDISALLTALQHPGMRQAVLAETGGVLYRSSRLSRLAEQLGWAIRQESISSVEPDCLRNAVNRFFYRRPSELPTSAPASQLSSEPHSFSRVFTGAFFEALALAFDAQDPRDSAALQRVSVTLGTLMLKAIKAAPIVTSYYAQLAAHLVRAANAEGEAYGNAVRTAMIRHGLLSARGIATAAMAAVPHGVAGVAGAASTIAPIEVSVAGFGLKVDKIKVLAAAHTKHFGVAGAASQGGEVADRSAEDDALEFLEDLMRRGRLDHGAFGQAGIAAVHPFKTKTHKLVQEGPDVVLRRTRIDCGLRCSSHTD